MSYSVLAGKLYHGDLVERAYCYMLALTGNFGKPGTGIQGQAVGGELATNPAVVHNLPREMLESDDPVGAALNFQQMALEDYKMRRKMDPTMPPSRRPQVLCMKWQRAGHLSRPRSTGTGMRAIRRYGISTWTTRMRRRKKISEYAEDALKQGWWEGLDFPVAPKALWVAGGNAIRRHRGRIRCSRLCGRSWS